MANKAHAATVRRLSERYRIPAGQTYDLAGEGLIIEVETAATVSEGVRKLKEASGRRFVAMTNKESISDAVELTSATDIGVMGPRGEVVKEAGR